MILRSILGLILCLAAAAGAIYMSGGALDFVLVPAAAAVLVLPLLAVLAGPGPRALGAAFRLASTAEEGSSPAADREALRVFRLLFATTLLSGPLGFLGKFIWMLKDLMAKEEVLWNIGNSLVPMAWALLLAAGLWLPLVARLEARVALGEEGWAKAPGKGAPRAFVVHAGLLLASLSVYYVSSLNGFAPIGIFEMPALYLALFIPFSYALAGPGLPGLVRAIAAVKAEGASLGQLKAAKAILRGMNTATLLAMGTGYILANAFLVAEWGNRMRAGPSVALGLITLMWGFLGLICIGLPLSAAADRKIALATKD